MLIPVALYSISGSRAELFEGHWPIWALILVFKLRRVNCRLRLFRLRLFRIGGNHASETNKSKAEQNNKDGSCGSLRLGGEGVVD